MTLPPRPKTVPKIRPGIAEIFKIVLPMNLPKRTAVMSAILFNVFPVPAQDWADVLHFGGNGFSQGVRIEIAEGGTKYVAGHLQNDDSGKSIFTVLCDTVQSSNDVPFGISSFILKLSGDNTIVWKRSVPGRVEDMFVDEHLNYYVVGHFEYYAKFGDRTYNAEGFADGYVVKYDDEGVIQWQKIVTGDQFNRLNAIDVNHNNELVISGVNNGHSLLLPDVFLPVGSFVLKLDESDGAVRDVKTFSSDRFWISAIATDPFNNIVLSGNYRGQIHFGDSVHGSEERRGIDGFLARLNSDFDELWLRSFVSTGNQYIGNISAVKADESGYYFCGSFSGGLTGDGIELPSQGGLDAYIGKADKDGNLIWLNPFGGLFADRVSDLAINQSYVCVTGEYASEIQFPSMTLLPTGVSDLLVLKYQKDGAFSKAYSAGNVHDTEYHTPYADVGNSLAIDKAGHIFVTGHVSGVARFADLQVRSVGASDCFLALIPGPGESPNFNGSVCIDADSKVMTYPNPTSGTVTLVSDVPILKVSVFDLAGRELFSYNPDRQSVNIDFSDLASSVYFLQIATRDDLEYVRIVRK